MTDPITQFLLFRVEKLKLFEGLDLLKSWVERAVEGKLGLLVSATGLVSRGSLWVAMLLRTAMANGKG